MKSKLQRVEAFGKWGLAMFRSILAGAALASAMVLSVGAHADVYQTFDIQWSGAALGNSATASAVATFDVTQLNNYNPGSGAYSGSLSPLITSLTLTVVGASSGNGTFVLGDFLLMAWDTNGGTLDLTKQLVGQATSDLPWGSLPTSYTCGSSTCIHSGGDFNLFGNFSVSPDAPYGYDNFELQTAEGAGDIMQLTSFVPTPLPAALPLFATGLGALGLFGWRRKRKNAAAMAA
jgi:hypothetical protein